MVKLIAKSPAHGLLPITNGALSLSEMPQTTITSIAPLKGQQDVVSKGLAGLGLAFPDPNRWLGTNDARIVWSGQGQAMLFGPIPAIDGAALTDQSDAWTCLVLEGDGASDVLARLTPLDLRDSQFADGHAARSLLGHMNALFLRTGQSRYEILVFRSMAQTAVHELTRAMESISAQAV